MVSISATQFKARCLSLLDEVASSGSEIVVTKRGRPVARLVPLEGETSMLGSVRFIGSDEDLVKPIDDSWDATGANS
jgi:prevent-host-death family protein